MTGGSAQLPEGGGRQRPWWRRTWVHVTGGILLLFLIVGAIGADPQDPANRATKAGAAPTATPTPSPTPDAVAEARARANDLVQDRNYLSARWPGDAYLFGRRFLELLEASASAGPES